MSELLFPLQIKRQYSNPIDPDTVFNTISEKTAYLSNPLRYAGQIVSCKEEEGKIFVLNNAMNSWVDLNSYADSISGSLNSRLTIVESNYATKSAPTSGTYNNVVVNSQGIVTSGGNIVYALANDLTSYALNTTVSSISAGLNSRVSTLESNTLGITGGLNQISGTFATNQDLYNLDLDLQEQITTANVDLSGTKIRVTNIENSFASKATPTSGTYNNVVVNSQGIVTSGGNVTYTKPSDLTPYSLTTTVASVSAGLNSRVSTLETDTFGITGGITQLNNKFVHLSGDENISGNKVFVNNLIINGKNIGGGGGVNTETNLAFGGNALVSNINGEQNVAIGDGALLNATDAYNNVAIGQASLVSLLDGEQNISIGSSSLFLNTIGTGNVAIGFASLSSNVTGDGSVAIGRNAGYYETGSNKLYITNSETTSGDTLIYGEFDNGKVWIKGKEILTTATNITGGLTQLDNRFVHLAGTEIISGSKSFTDDIKVNNITVGKGNFVDTGVLCIGEGAGSNTSGYFFDNHIFIGANAGANASFSNFNIGIGNYALENEYDSYGNTAVGHYALRNCNGGGNNAFGIFALENLGFEGQNNLAMGQGAMQYATKAQDNVALGHYALQSNIDGYYNIAIGSITMSLGQHVDHNIAMGFQTLNNLTNGSENIVLGDSAGMNFTSGSFNVMIGCYSGYNGVTGSNNVFVGRYSGMNEMGSNKLYISNDTDGTSATALIYGEFDKGKLYSQGKKIVTTSGITSGTYNTVLVNSDGLVISGGNVVYSGSGSVDLTPYALTSTVASISAGLNSRVSTLETKTNGITGGLTQLDGRFVNITGDSMIGRLSVNPSSTSGNEVFGANAGNILAGENNTIVGYGAMQNADPNSILNIAIGYGAAKNLQNYGNIAIGPYAMETGPNAGGGNNIAIGMFSQQNAVNEAQNNISIGLNTLQSMTDGQDNTVIGVNTAANLTNGYYNVALGTLSLYANTVGNANVAIGSMAGMTNAFGDQNVYLGDSAGTNLVSGNNNIFIGFNAGYGEISASNKLYIDSFVSGVSTSANALIYGDFQIGKVWIKGHEILTTASVISGGGSSSLQVTGAGTLVSNVSVIEITGTAVTSVTDMGSGKVKVTLNGGAAVDPMVVSITGNAFTPDGLADVYDYTLTADATIDCPSNLPNGGTIIIRFTQPSGSTATIGFNNANGFTWKFSNGNVPVLTPSFNAIDILTVVRVSNDMYVTIIKNFL